MRVFITCLLISLLSFTIIVDQAIAARFGGGRSFGVQRSYGSLFSQRAASYHQPQKMFAQRGQQANRWGGLLGGLLIGGLLSSLFMGHGFGTGLLTWIVVAAGIAYVVGIFKRKTQMAYQSTVSSNTFQQNPYTAQQFAGSSSTFAPEYPDGFVADVFLRAAKVLFIRLQTAYDQKNLLDLNEFTAPDVFAEIKMQLDERGNQANQTIIHQLNAELLDVSKQVQGTLASVHFTGSIQENNTAATTLDEIWHFRQFAKQSEWVVAGIQQEVVEPI